MTSPTMSSLADADLHGRVALALYLVGALAGAVGWWVLARGDVPVWIGTMAFTAVAIGSRTATLLVLWVLFPAVRGRLTPVAQSAATVSGVVTASHVRHGPRSIRRLTWSRVFAYVWAST